jgi:hypothetical protein
VRTGPYLYNKRMTNINVEEGELKTEEGEGLGIDILRNVESISSQVNETMAARGRSVFRRYPLTFTLLALFGVVAVSEGMKGVLESFGIFAGHPWYLLAAGLVILIFTGKLYKKLDK